MIIKRISLDNFRIHERYNLECEKEITLITGGNGIGKTSVLEAIYIAMRGKSFRAGDKDIVKRERDFYGIEMEYENGEKIKVVYEGLREMVMGRVCKIMGGKKYFIIKDNKTARIPKEYKYPVILFLPEDLHLVATSPTKRRDYFDKMWGQLDEKYHNSLLRYTKVLRQRNELLKKEGVKAEELFSWNVLLAKYGSEILRKRKKWIAKVNEDFSEVYNSIAKTGDRVELKVKTLSESDESEYLRRLEKEFERDKMNGNTGFGIHKDNYVFYFNEVEAEGSASRGEVRSIVLALKFIEAQLVVAELGKKPMILLDDVFSELDKGRQACLVENFRKYQIILTSVEGVIKY